MSVSEVCAKRDESKESPLWSSNRDAFCAQGSSCRVDTGVSAQLSTGSPGSYLLPGAELHFFCAHCSNKIIISDYENQLQDYENPSWGERKRPHSSRMRGWVFFFSRTYEFNFRQKWISVCKHMRKHMRSQNKGPLKWQSVILSTHNCSKMFLL